MTTYEQLKEIKRYYDMVLKIINDRNVANNLNVVSLIQETPSNKRWLTMHSEDKKMFDLFISNANKECSCVTFSGSENIKTFEELMNDMDYSSDISDTELFLRYGRINLRYSRVNLLEILEIME